ncbi:asparagine synthase (glutamine-hydrolyzing) [Carboxylicivirga caseinilyticus]|uniref:asparagine synthase (glutamine-hydrolyzing) n=1 Tax=Carboxylicivirga caseinilyticus TaxID=3417572 RepID=UPI003D33436D|nr:asparagine synthase (glutamine-hydrolyzing) [Marinilabiliaceae bacterium A049]
MCGITGLYSKIQINDIRLRVEKMNDSIIHRGPDAGGYYLDENNLALGHRRLSIIDTAEHANQPMASNNGRWQIIFNGEIYNFQQIKSELDYDFQTQSDTEVILAAVDSKGLDWFLQKANGMFAIALFDTIEKDLFLIRDRLGIKPLFYYYDNKKIVFSSEIKSILSSGLVQAKFNEKAVDEYLGNRYVRAPYSFFKDIYQSIPGTYLKIDKELNLSKFVYWDLPQKFNCSKFYNENDILERFEKQLTKAIRYRLIADVPLGTYLSGGVDSSLITAITALNKRERVNTYTIGFPELNEFKYSELVADKYNTSHHEILMKRSDYVDNWERLIKFKDAPLGVPNEIPLAVMSSKLKEKITVVLSGEGADELLGGYGRIFRSGFDYYNEKPDKSFYDYFIDKYEYVPRKMRDELLNTSFGYRQEFDNEVKEKFGELSNEEQIFRFFHQYHVKGLLNRVDTTTMQTSVEARVPFLDHELIEFVYNEIPYDLKLRWISGGEAKAFKLSANEYSEILDTPKYLLRKLSYKYLQKEIIERKKVGFPVPLTEWFSNLEVLAKELLPKADWLKDNVVDELLVQTKSEERAGQILWMFINIELFRKNYFEKDWTW